jgi:hypothetical protein
VSSNVYICYTLMHVYISILKTINNSESENILVITDHIDNYSELHNRLLNSRIFNDIKIVKDKEITKEFNENRFKFLFFKPNIKSFFKKNVEFDSYIKNLGSDIQVNIFLDEPRFSQYLILSRNNVNLIEDGYGLYSIEKTNRKSLFKALLGIPKTKGKDKRVKTIEATKPGELNKKLRKKANHLNLEALQEGLTESQKSAVIKMFLKDDININVSQNLLLLTQPFSEDQCITEKAKIDLYKKVIKNYGTGYNIFIKAHPREKTIYSYSVEEDITEIQSDFPIEMLNLMPFLNFEKVITINSSAINNLIFISNKIELGLDYDEELAEGFSKIFNVII